MQYIYWFGNKAPQYLDHTVVVYQFLGSLPIIFAVATMFSLAFESPMLALEKLIFPQPSRAAPVATDVKGPVTNGVSQKAAQPGTAGQHEHVNEAFNGDSVGLPSSEEPSKAPKAVNSVDGDETTDVKY